MPGLAWIGKFNIKYEIALQIFHRCETIKHSTCRLFQITSYQPFLHNLKPLRNQVREKDDGEETWHPCKKVRWERKERVEERT